MLIKPTVAASSLAIVVAACAQLAGPPQAIPQAFAPNGAPNTSSGFKTLVEFNEVNGCNPIAGLVALKDTLYGTTTCGGRFAEGEVYSISSAGKFGIVYNFTNDARYAYAPVTVVGDTLYGAAVGGGKYHSGTVYSLGLNGKKNWVYSFRHELFPYAGLTNVNGTLYGTTVEGGGSYCYGEQGCGSVFKISSSGKEREIYGFKGGGSDGAQPWAGLVNVNGTLYGTTSGGGSDNDGTVFSVTPSGVEHVLHSFGGPDGINPYGTLIYANGLLYGTTEEGGSYGWGTVYSITTSGTEQVVYDFADTSQYDASEPEAGLLYLNGELYGTTVEGGGTGCGGLGCGTVFEVSPSGTEHVLYSFQGGSDGKEPQSALAAVNGVLYGTTPYGGTYYEYGTVFALKP